VLAIGLPEDTVASFLKPYFSDSLVMETVDITDGGALLEAASPYDVRSIIHLAGPPIGRHSPTEEFRQNTQRFLNILELGRVRRARRISMASSIATYVGLDRGPFREDMLGSLMPRHPVEAFKKAEELMGFYYADATATSLVSLRLAHIYGPLYRSRRHLPARLTHVAVRSATQREVDDVGLPPPHADACCGDLCYVKDCARGISLLHSAEDLRRRLQDRIRRRADEPRRAGRRILSLWPVELRTARRPVRSTLACLRHGHCAGR
jgi:UDP-glucose 4-epimerase